MKRFDILAIIDYKTCYGCCHCGEELFWDNDPAIEEWEFCPFCGWPLDDEM